MEKTYIFGHKNPDTDAVTSAIALSYLKNQLGENTEPRVLGSISKETKYALDTFHVKEPKYLDHVYLQIKDVLYHKNYYLPDTTSILDTYETLLDKGITGIPLVKENREFSGLITVKMILKELVNGNFTSLHTSYENILHVLKAESILKFDDEIDGSIIAAAFRSTTFMNSVHLDSSSILIVGDRHSIIEYAVMSKVKLLIIVGNGEIHPEHIEIAKENHVNIIRTAYDSFHTAKLLDLSSYVKNVTAGDYPTCFDENTIFSEFLEKSRKLKHNNYPIVNKKGICQGLIRITDIMEKNRKKVILVDHNEADQSVAGLEEAEIVEIVDHHRIGDLTTSNPINFRNMAVGSTNTIVYCMYQENHIEIPQNIAGIMISGILSDTLNLTSPTTTDKDREAVRVLAPIAGVDATTYALDMLKAGTSFDGMTEEEIINIDCKLYPIGDEKIAIAQVFAFNIDSVLSKKEAFLEAMENELSKNGYTGMVVVVTDILANGSYFLYTEHLTSIMEEAYPGISVQEGFFQDGCVSRKKQVVPAIVNAVSGN